MNITEIELTNYGSWEHVRLSIDPSVLLISGPNGAGKSTLLSAMRFGLYGVSSDAGRLIRRGTDSASVAVEVTTDAGDLRVERTIRRSGAKVVISLDLRQHVDEQLLPLACTTVSETQALLEGLLGVSLEVMEASAWSMQGSGALFCEAKPADRKRVLMAALPSMELWPMLHEQAKAEKRTADDAANVARAELERLDGAAVRLAEAHMRLQGAEVAWEVTGADQTLAEEDATRLAAEAEAAREARRQHATAVEAEQRARADHERAGVERQAADEALARAKAAAANAPDLTRAQQEAREADLQLAEIEAEQTALREASTKWREQYAEAERELAEATGKRDRNTIEIGQVQERITQASSGTCPECLQVLHDDSLLTRLKDRRQTLVAAQVEVVAAYTDWQARVDYLTKNAPIAPDDAKLRIFQRRAQDAQTALARAESIQSLAGSIDAAQQRARDAFDRQNETAEVLRTATAALDAAEASQDETRDSADAHHFAVEALATARAAHSAAAADLARAEEAAKLAERQAAEETAARERLEVATREAATLDWLAKGFGPTGCPAMIIDSTLGDLADEANRVLAELASPIRVDLRSQRVTQKGDLVDALEIVVSMNAMEASYETLSGGERTRVALALRAALTRLLASKRGARVKILVVDEPAGLDSSACEALAGVLNEFVAAGVFASVILVTHQSELSDLIANVVRVEKGADGCSRLVGAAAQIERVPS